MLNKKSIILTACFLLIALRVITILRPIKTYAELLCDLASEHEKKAMTVKAVKLYQKAIFHNPENPKPYFLLGNIYSDLQDQEKMIQYYQKVVDIKPLDPYYITAYMRLGYERLKQKKYLEAIKIFRTVVLVRGRYHMAFYYMGLCYYELGDKDMVEKTVKELNSLQEYRERDKLKILYEKM